jgi:hypothetical protein
MEFSTQQISPERWGIYSGDRLLATVGCKATCETFMANFVSGRRDAPTDDVNALYQAPKLRKESVSQASEKSKETPESLIDSRLDAQLSAQVLTVKELESAVLKAQESQLQESQLQESQSSVSQHRVSQLGRKTPKKRSKKDKVRSAF